MAFEKKIWYDADGSIISVDTPRGRNASYDETTHKFTWPQTKSGVKVQYSCMTDVEKAEYQKYYAWTHPADGSHKRSTTVTVNVVEGLYMKRYKDYDTFETRLDFLKDCLAMSQRSSVTLDEMVSLMDTFKDVQQKKQKNNA